VASIGARVPNKHDNNLVSKNKLLAMLPNSYQEILLILTKLPNKPLATANL
jgi:hypothetical protein